MKHILIGLVSICTLAASASCFSQDGMHYGGLETFRYWAGSDPWDGMEVLNGQYWSSAHFSKEYDLHMEIKVPLQMALDFIKGNHLKIADEEEAPQHNGPDWFMPSKKFTLYTRGYLGSLYFIDEETGHMFIHEVQY